MIRAVKIVGPWVFAFVVAGLVLWIAIELMSRFGLFDIPKDDSGTKALAASIGIIGAVLSAVITLIGIVFKYSIDDRNARTAAQAQQSNRTDVAIRAVSLLSENNKDATPHQIGGAVLALVSLGELELAISLLGTLWPDKLVSPNVADAILSTAFKKGSEDVKISAATILALNANQIIHGSSFHWPLHGVGWREDLPEECRFALACAAAEWLILGLEKEPTHVPDAAMVLHQALGDSRVSHIAVACLGPLVVFPPADGVAWGEHHLTIKDLTESLKTHPDALLFTRETAYRNRVNAALGLGDGEPSRLDQGSNN